MRYIITLITMVLIAGCAGGCKGTQPKKTIVNVTFASDMKNELVGVKFECLGRELHGGMLGPGYDSTTLDVPWPRASDGKVIFIDRKTQKPYIVEVSLTPINEKIDAGKCHGITIRILDYDKAEVVCE